MTQWALPRQRRVQLPLSEQSLLQVELPRQVISQVAASQVKSQALPSHSSVVVAPSASILQVEPAAQVRSQISPGGQL